MSIPWSYDSPHGEEPGSRKEEMQGLYKVKDRRGRKRYIVSKHWPNGSGRLRIYAPNSRSNQAFQTRIESSVLDSTWKRLKQELSGGNRTVWTVRSFHERLFEEY